MAFVAMFFTVVAVHLLLVNCDTYMHTFRGCNNRLNEDTANRKTNNRLFDSQNNNRGGYNVGDRTNKKAQGRTAEIYGMQHRMEYFQSSKRAASKISIEWTMQHGCGGNEDNNPHKLNCNAVLQFMCQPDTLSTKSPSEMKSTEEKTLLISSIRDGTTTNRNEHKPPSSTYKDWMKQFVAQNKFERGMHEPYQWYDKCSRRLRNKGLFTADQKLREVVVRVGRTRVRKSYSIYTRQNPKGNRNGYECPEERDYYPYWHPTDWKDVAVYAENASMCDHYQKESFNVKSKWECVEKWSDTKTPKHFSEMNTKETCKNGGGEWLEFHNFLEKAVNLKSETACKSKGNIWARPIYGYAKECLVPLLQPDCSEAPWSRVNHNGNVPKAKGDLGMANYVWSLPNFPSNQKQRCVFRLRYNISTDDYDPQLTDSKSNGDNSPIQTDPKVDIGAQNIELQLNINTAQTGRTFQDRSHVFKLVPRPSSVPENKKIYNVQVRGKRGNIVQTYPAVEYDFSPTNLKIAASDLVHIQWTGSNTHNNKGGGDGQSGDDGEGTKGTDRNNVVPMINRNHNYPMLSETDGNLFNNVEKVHWSPPVKGSPNHVLTAADIYLQYASSGYYGCVQCASADSLKTRSEKNDLMDALLNNAPASYRGMLLQLKPGDYNYMCTRNNNLSNRSEKGTIKVTA